MGIRLLHICFLIFALQQLPKYGYGAEWVNKTLIHNAVSRGAVCLDGSPAGYYMAPGSGCGSTKWLLFIEGGAWCNSTDDCVSRASIYLGSTYGRTPALFSGILDDSPIFNPDFYNWNRVSFIYCDGSSFLGDTVDQQTKLFYRGSRVFDAIADDLLSKGLNDADNVILSGSSAGGLATILHCDNFRARLPNAQRFKCISDSGFFLHAKNLPGAMAREDYFSQVVELHGAARFLPESCTSKNHSPGSCFFPENLVDYIQTPVFLVESSFDLYQLRYMIAPYLGDENEWHKCLYGNNSCGSAQLKILREFQKIFIKTLRDHSHSPSRGMFVHSCYQHTHIVTKTSWKCSSVVNNTLRNKTIADAIGDWYYDRSSFQYIDLRNKVLRNCTPSHNSSETDKKCIGLMR